MWHFAAELLDHPTGIIRSGHLRYRIAVVFQRGDLIENELQPAQQPSILARA
jgi:hypothetical protein